MIEIRTAFEGEPTYGNLVDILPDPDRGGYLLIIDVQGLRRKIWFADPAQNELAAAEAEVETARTRANEALRLQREAEQRARAAGQAVRLAEAKRIRDVVDLPEDEQSLDK